MLDQLSLLKTKRAAIGDDPRTAVLDASIEKLALAQMAAEREKLFEELTLASLRVRSLTAQIHGCRIFLREHSEQCADPDDARKLMAQVERWSASSMPTCAASPEEIQAARRHWLQMFSELRT